MSVSDYEIIKAIGKGAFGVVTKIRRKSDGEILVWKEMSYGLMSEREKALIVSEVNILRELRNPFIVKYYDRIIDRSCSTIYIIMEHLEGGDLKTKLRDARKKGKYIEEKWIWKTFAQLVLAIRDCHRHKTDEGKRPIIHRDIKPGNILLDSSGNVKLGDFGLAKELNSDSKFAKTYVGTPYYMSPEVINEQRYDERSDIWALGCLVYEMAALRPPFEASNQVNLAAKINKGRFDSLPSCFSDDLYKCIRWMLNIDINKRPRIEDLENFFIIRPLITEYRLDIREYQLNIFAKKYTSRMNEVKLKEAKLLEKEESLKILEAQLKEREDKLNSKEKENQDVLPSTSYISKASSRLLSATPSFDNYRHLTHLTRETKKLSIDYSRR